MTPLVQRLVLIALAAECIFGQTRPDLIFQAPLDRMESGRLGGDGKWIAVSANAGSIRIIEVSSGRELRTIQTRSVELIRGVFAADPRSDRLAALVGDGETAVYDVRTGTELWRQPVPPTWNRVLAAPQALEFSRDGRQLRALTVLANLPTVGLAAAAANAPAVLHLSIWDAESGAKLVERSQTFVGGYSYRAGFGAEDTSAFVSITQVSADKMTAFTIVLDLETGQQVGRSLDGIAVALHLGAGRALLQRPLSPAPRLVDIASGSEIPIDALAMTGGGFSPDGRTLVMVGPVFGWKICDASTGRVRFLGFPSVPIAFPWVSFTDQGDSFLVGEETAILVNVYNPAHYRVIAGKILDSSTASASPAVNAGEGVVGTRRITSSYARDGRWLAVRSEDGAVELWDGSTGDRLPQRIRPELSGDEINIQAAEDGSLLLRLPPAPSKQAVKYKVRKRILGAEIPALEFRSELLAPMSSRAPRQQSFNGIQCVSENGEYAIGIQTDAQGQARANLERTSDGATVAEVFHLGVQVQDGCSISPDGSKLAIHRIETVPVVWNATSWIIGKMPGGTEHYFIYDVQAKHITAELEADESGRGTPFHVSTIRWSPDSKLIAAGGSNIANGPIFTWDTNSGRQLRQFENSFERKALSFTPDGAKIVTGAYLDGSGEPNYGLDLRDARSGSVTCSLPDAISTSTTPAFSPNGRVMLIEDRSHALAIWRVPDCKMLGQLRTFGSGEWLVTAPSGAFDGTPRGWSSISWTQNGKIETAPGEIFFNEFFRPGLLAELLAGRESNVERMIAAIDRRQPSVKIEASAAGGRAAKIELELTEAPPSDTLAGGSGVRDVRLFRNGALVKAWRGNLTLESGKSTLEATIATEAGLNRFSAYAFNAADIRSQEVTTDLKMPGPSRSAVAWVLAIGVNEYANREFDLKFAGRDAKSLAEEFAASQSALKQFADVRSILLLDRDATGANIRLALALLAGGNGPVPESAPDAVKAIRPAQPEDAVIIFFAGHGVASGDRFYLVPHDLGYAGPRSQVAGRFQEVIARSISDRDLEQELEPIAARHLVLIVDACQSGQALESDEQRRGPMNSRGLAQLAWEKGMSLLAASQAYQPAIESSKLQHGYLTFALVEEGLKTAVADMLPADGFTTLAEWLDYTVARVPQLQSEALEEARRMGRQLVFDASPDRAGATSLQTPRVFVKRDGISPPLIVTKH